MKIPPFIVFLSVLAAVVSLNSFGQQPPEWESKLKEYLHIGKIESEAIAISHECLDAFNLSLHGRKGSISFTEAAWAWARATVMRDGQTIASTSRYLSRTLDSLKDINSRLGSVSSNEEAEQVLTAYLIECRLNGMRELDWQINRKWETARRTR